MHTDHAPSVCTLDYLASLCNYNILLSCVALLYLQTYINTVPLEDKAQGSVSVKTYYRYFKAGGGFVGCLLLLVAFVVGEVSTFFCIFP